MKKIWILAIIGIIANLFDLITTHFALQLPYLYEKSHDGSPLKLYEYLKFNKPCLTSMNYEVQNKFVLNYSQDAISKVEIAKLLLLSGSSEISQSILKSDYLSYKINLILPYTIK